MSGFSITLALSERLTPALTAEPPTFGHYGVTGGISFDPKSAFVNGTNWNSAVNAVAKMHIDPTDVPDCFNESSNETRPNCVNKYSVLTASARQRSKAWGIADAFVPKLDFKRISQADLAASSGIVPNEPALNTLTLTWDLQRLIAPDSTRVDVDKTYRTFKKEQGTQSKLCVTVTAGVNSYISVPSDFSGESCQKLAIDIKAQQYSLSCVSPDFKLGPFVDAADSEPAPASGCGW